MLFYPPGVAITPTTFPEAIGGTGVYTTYTLLPPTGLTFDASTRILTGTPVAATATYTANYGVTDSNTAVAAAAAAFTICPTGAVAAGNVSCTAPTYSALVLTAPSDQTYTAGTAIAALTLPAATGGTTGGTAALPTEVYSIAPIPSGLAFDPATRVLSGTPDTVAAAATITYRVQDAGSHSDVGRNATLTFTITVEPAVPTGVTLSVNPATVTESATATTITVTATVDGGTFAVERVVGFSTAGSGSGSTATQNDYTSVGFTPLTIPANMASASTTIEFTAAVDAVAEPAGETVVIEGILQLPNSQTADTSIPVTSATLTINDPVANIAPVYSAVIFGSLSYVQNRMISPATLPAATTPGNGDTVYSIAVLPAGLTFDAATRVLTGTPTVALAQTSYTLTAHDSDDDMTAGDSATFPVRITVQADLTPTFTGVDVPAQVFRAGQRVDVTLPAATGGDGALTYTLTGPSAAALATALPGATFTASTRVLSGVLTGDAFAATAFIYTATDQDSDEATATLMITVEANKAPAYPEGTTFADQVFFPNQVVDLTLPGITPGTGDISITYTLTPALPDGLTFNAAASVRTITGTTTAAAVATTPYTLTVTDGDTNTEVGDTATLMFTITVEADTEPAFADDAMIPEQTYTQGVTITPLTFPEATGGNAPFTYTLTPALPPGLTFNGDLRPPTLTGTTTLGEVRTDVLFRLTVTDNDGDTAFRVILDQPGCAGHRPDLRRRRVHRRHRLSHR